MSNPALSSPARRFLAWRERVMADETQPLAFEPREKGSVLDGSAPKRDRRMGNTNWYEYSLQFNAVFDKRLFRHHGQSSGLVK